MRKRRRLRDLAIMGMGIRALFVRRIDVRWRLGTAVLESSYGKAIFIGWKNLQGRGLVAQADRVELTSTVATPCART